MPDITAVAGKVAGIISLAAFIPYILAILRGETKPNRATWVIWAVVGFMTGASYYFSGANHTIWVPVSYIIGPVVVSALSIKYGVGGWTRFDRCCLLGAGMSMALWLVFSSPLVALLINLFIDFMGVLPTIRKAYRDPESEDRIAWALFFTGNIANLLAVERWTFAIAVYPIYMFIGSGLITAFIVFRQNSKANT
ncbi:hypothetical protein KGQ34_03850 [Patescibacteria group bacterium]|nr:hypothetical protein [Patescibacteria group bacterium]